MSNFERQTPQDAGARSRQVIQKQMSRAARSNQRQRLMTDKLRMVRMTTGRLVGRGRLLRRTTPPGHDSDRPTTSQGKHNTQKKKRETNSQTADRLTVRLLSGGVRVSFQFLVFLLRNVNLLLKKKL